MSISSIASKLSGAGKLAGKAAGSAKTVASKAVDVGKGASQATETVKNLSRGLGDRVGLSREARDGNDDDASPKFLSAFADNFKLGEFASLAGSSGAAEILGGALEPLKNGAREAARILGADGVLEPVLGANPQRAAEGAAAQAQADTQAQSETQPQPTSTQQTGQTQQRTPYDKTQGFSKLNSEEQKQVMEALTRDGSPMSKEGVTDADREQVKKNLPDMKKYPNGVGGYSTFASKEQQPFIKWWDGLSQNQRNALIKYAEAETAPQN